MTVLPEPMTPAVDASMIERYCDIVFGYTEGHVCIRILPETGGKDARPIAEFPAAGDGLPAMMARMAQRAASLGRALYCVPATVSEPGSAKRKDLRETAVLVADIDAGDIAGKLAHLTRHVGQPALIVASGGVTPEGHSKRHVYWRLTEAVSGQDLDRIARLQGHLAATCGTDDSFDRSTQPIRVPGSLYFKHGARAAARIVEEHAVEYDLGDLEERIHSMPHFGEIVAPPATLALGIDRPQATELLERRVRDRGQDGITRFEAIGSVAGHLIRKARLGAGTMEDAWAQLVAYNVDRIDPPWPETRLRLTFDRLRARDQRNREGGISCIEGGGSTPDSAEPPPTSEDGLAVSFVRHHGMDWLFVSATGHWLAWTGTRWEEDRTSRHREVIRQVCRAGAPLDKPGEARRIASSKTILAVERILESDPELTIDSEALDADGMEFNCAGGIVDLSTGALTTHCRGALMTHLAPATPRPGCPRWLSFLEDVTGGDGDLAAYLQRFCGYCLTGSMKEQVFLFLHGEGANGKSVFLQTIASVLGDYVVTSSSETFLASRIERNASELAQFRGARLVIVTETEPGRAWAESRIKAIVGGDTIRARLLYANSFEYAPTFKLVVAGNHRPAFSDVSEAMRRRLHLVPFETVIPANRRDRDLPTKLLAERDGILAWMIDGLADWRVRGLAPPERVTAASRDYFADEDQVGHWLETQCETGPHLRASASALFASWKQFADSQNLPAGSARSFASALNVRGFVSGRSSRERFYTGLRLRGGCQ